MEDTAADRLKSRPEASHTNANASYFNETVLQIRAHPPSLNSIFVGKAQVTGPVEWLLAFSIIGFAKCGTSFLQYWLSKSPLVYMDPGEKTGFPLQHPGSMAQHFYQVISENKGNQSQKKWHEEPNGFPIPS